MISRAKCSLLLATSALLGVLGSGWTTQASASVPAVTASKTEADSLRPASISPATGVGHVVQLAASARLTLAATGLYQPLCWVQTVGNDAVYGTQVAWSFRMTFYWCSTLPVLIGPGIRTITTWWDAAAVNAHWTHGTALWASISGWSYEGFDSSGQWDPHFITRSGSAHGGMEVWRQAHWQLCSIRAWPCTDDYPYAHLQVDATGHYSVQTSLGK
jgi:hypothetical protein